LAAAETVNVDPFDDHYTQRVLACACYRLANFISSDWASHYPDLLGRLLPIASSLPDGLCLSDIYPDSEGSQPSHSHSHSHSPSDAEGDDNADPIVLPPLIFELYTLRKALVEAKDVPDSCTIDLQAASHKLSEARRHFQSSYDAPKDVRQVAQRIFTAAYGDLHSQMIVADVKLMERQANVDRIVRLLRGEYHFTARHFDFDTEYDGPSQPSDPWRGSAHPSIYYL